ncbi:MAG: prepilin-type N-terminal cleavage/methylation domain-containing protein [Alphaproteobacteria bacterium]|nr:prepilin-type N-terminal cleavage/methylation domain-containing protein [Alphaproteobacteria bacterium]
MTGTRALRQRGTTLIEVLVAIVLMSILVLGVSALWAWVGNLMFDLTVRQKAVFALNGEMERLASLHRFTDFGTAVGFTESTDGYTAVLGGLTGLPTDRLVYGDDLTGVQPFGQDFVTTDSATFRANPGKVYAYPAGTALTKRNAIMLDEVRGLTARLSWTESVTGPDCYPNQCKVVVLYLEFPFRLVDADPFVAAGKTEALTLMTMVGRYR